MSEEEQRDIFTRTYFERKTARAQLAAAESELQRAGKALARFADLLLRFPDPVSWDREMRELPAYPEIIRLLGERTRLREEVTRLEALVQRMEAEG